MENQSGCKGYNPEATNYKSKSSCLHTHRHVRYVPPDFSFLFSRIPVDNTPLSIALIPKDYNPY